MFLEESNLYEIKNMLLMRKADPGLASIDVMRKWLDSSEANDILFLETPSTAIYVLESLNEAFVNSLTTPVKIETSMLHKFDPYIGEVFVDRQQSNTLKGMQRKYSKKYRSEAKGLHARVSTLEDQRDSMQVDSMMAKKMFEI